MCYDPRVSLIVGKRCAMLSVRKKILHIAGPIVLENVLVFSASLVTTAMVGRLSSMDITAQNISTRLVNTLMLLFKGMGVGVTVVTAYAHARGNEARCARTLHRTLSAALPLSFVLTALVFARPRLFISAFTSDAAIMAATEWYMRAMGFVIPIICAHHLLVGSFNGHGETRIPMYSAVVVNLVNIVLGYVLIFGHLGVPALGIRGAACAYITAQAVGLALLIVVRWKKHLPAVSASDDATGPVLGEVLSVGVPSALEGIMYNVALILLSRALLPYGTDSFAAYQLGGQAENICYMVGMAFVTTSTTLAALAVGRRDGELYLAYFKELFRLGTVVAGASAVILLFLPEQLMGLLTDKRTLIDIGKYYLYAMVPAQFPQIYNNILIGFLRSSGYKRVPMFIIAAGLWCVRVPVAVVTGLVLHGSILWIWAGIALDQFTRLALLGLFYRKKRVIGGTIEGFAGGTNEASQG